MTGAKERTETAIPARERLLRSAYTLFSRHGTRAVGVDTIIEHAGVAKKTLYTHFASKEELVLAFLDERERIWTRDWLQAQVRARARTPAGRLLAIFDVFADWFATPDFEGCSFINVMLEHPEADSAVRRASVAHLSAIRGFLSELVAQAGVVGAEGSLAGPSIDAEGSLAGPSIDAEGSLAGPSIDAEGSLAGPSIDAEGSLAGPSIDTEQVDGLARQWHILMKGSIVAAGEGDTKAAARAREMGALLLAHHGIDPAAAD